MYQKILHETHGIVINMLGNCLTYYCKLAINEIDGIIPDKKFD